MTRKHAANARRAPRKLLGSRTVPRDAVYHHCFQDHNNRMYTVVTSSPVQARSIPKLSIQLYCLGDAAPSPEALGRGFLSSDAIEGWAQASNYSPRVDVFTNFASVDECIAHHHREKAHRKAAIQELRRAAVAGLSEEDAQEKLASEIRGREPLPHIVPSWCPTQKFWDEYRPGSRYQSWILVVPEDRRSWEDAIEKGLLLVSFDLDVNPAMFTFVCDCDVEEDTLLEGEDGWVDVELSGYQECEPVATRLLCVRNKLRDHFGAELGPGPERDAWRTPGSDGTLYHFWSDEATSALRDCTYRGHSCDGCREFEPHDVCENELDEHYFDEDGQCVACRRQSEYRRRSKRIAARGQKQAHEG
ncbi:hypothetical protein B0T10DRAFT_495163 [Thelonectria olida]|uniref:Uncharacterized protein n=1 Tax=Thelonectria olida TaxID=1576542 RepID=A0A9P9ALE0_9HYPO|nr:hypothetical protein B0T10DRAFT_495163 [Thelonectria olida]